MTIKQIQALLIYLGYNPGMVDGINGPNTTAAVLAFQAQEALEQDGKPGPATQRALLAAVADGRMYYTPSTEEKPSSGQPPDSTGTFWDEIKYFRREEFRCKCGGKYCNGFPAEPAEETVRIADEIRERAGVPLNVNSGLRCPKWNAIQGGVANSRHVTGRAVDLSGNISPSRLRDIAVAVQAEMIPGRGGIGLYSWGIHEDNGTYSRWNG